MNAVPAPLRFTLPAEPASLAVIRSRLRHWLPTASVDDAAAADILVAVGEAAANAVEHSTLDAAHPVHVEVTASAHAGLVELTVTDNGRWRPAPASPGHRGRGKQLMHALLDSVTITPSALGTTVRMRKAFTVA